jgi:riboflavin synthase
MFTGIVETLGTLVRRTPRGPGARLAVRGDLVGHGREPLVLGESIAVDGVCLTVDAIVEPGGHGKSSVFEADASSETLSKTTLGSLAVGASVNLERALAVGGRFGGHIVSGHVDGVGQIREKHPAGTATSVVFDAPPELLRFIAQKGSITVSGVSLTVNRVSATGFEVMLISHTRGRTSLDSLPIGSSVNLEVDLLARYVARLLETGRPDGYAASSDSSTSHDSQPSSDSRLMERLRASGYA